MSDVSLAESESSQDDDMSVFSEYDESDYSYASSYSPSGVGMIPQRWVRNFVYVLAGAPEGVGMSSLLREVSQRAQDSTTGSILIRGKDDRKFALSIYPATDATVNVHGALLVYDTNRRDTFDQIGEHFLEQARQKTNPISALMLIGNTCSDNHHANSTREVSEEEGAQFARDNELLFLETSFNGACAAAEDELDKVLSGITTSLYDKILEAQASNPPIQVTYANGGTMSLEDPGCEHTVGSCMLEIARQHDRLATDVALFTMDYGEELTREPEAWMLTQVPTHVRAVLKSEKPLSELELRQNAAMYYPDENMLKRLICMPAKEWDVRSCESLLRFLKKRLGDPLVGGKLCVNAISHAIRDGETSIAQTLIAAGMNGAFTLDAEYDRLEHPGDIAFGRSVFVSEGGMRRQNMVDGTGSEWWTGDREAWIMVDLGQECHVDAIHIQWWGISRAQKFTVFATSSHHPTEHSSSTINDVDAWTVQCSEADDVSKAREHEDGYDEYNMWTNLPAGRFGPVPTRGIKVHLTDGREDPWGMRKFFGIRRWIVIGKRVGA